MFIVPRSVDSVLKPYGLSEDYVVHFNAKAKGVKKVRGLDWSATAPIACLSEFKPDEGGRESLIVHGIYATECSKNELGVDVEGAGNRRRRPSQYCLDPEQAYELPPVHDEVYLNRVKISAEELTDDLANLIRKYVRKKCNGKSSIAYGLAGVSASVFHGIADQELPKDYGRDIADKIRKPEKETLFRLGFVFRLNIDEMRELLATADHAFSPCRIRDKVIETCFLDGILDHDEVNYELIRNHCEEMKFGEYSRLERKID